MKQKLEARNAYRSRDNWFLHRRPPEDEELLLIPEPLPELLPEDEP
jgi:hypothetical protein